MGRAAAREWALAQNFASESDSSDGGQYAGGRRPLAVHLSQASTSSLVRLCRVIQSRRNQGRPLMLLL